MSQAVTASRAHRTETRLLRAMALGFGIGSVLFALGTIVIWLDLAMLTANVVYAVGAVGFTSAATVQWRASVRHHPDHERLRVRAETDLTDPEWTSAVTQLVGTLCFNVMTIRAVLQSLGEDVTAAQIWRPDAIGSVLFLVSSWIAWHPIVRKRRHQLIPRRSAWICWCNMLGSVFFGISAWGASLLADGSMRSPAAGNWGTFLGALGFLAASILLWPPSRDPRTQPDEAGMPPRRDSERSA